MFKFMPPVMTVRCYAVDGVMIDTGIYSKHRRVLKFANEQSIRQAIITHHHEDHTGSASALVDAGFTVLASPASATKMASGFKYKLYHQLVWGKAPTVQVDCLDDIIETDHYQFKVIPAPGHCDDQVVFFEANEGWLFSGDAFLADKIKLFRGDEDFAKTMESLKRLVTLEFEHLFCAHRPVMKHGKQALQNKLNYLTELEGQTRYLHQKGYSVKAISQQLLGNEDSLRTLLTRGDMSKQNVIRSILFGPIPREERNP
ncbi:MBL fold metallo-hydrolase [Spartinivicinus poritis]|uniref:MBL fold metallo-hydrolase n=1 Tax=Spartinivicinus poritis TaxID=2994640 RepID=A0ABT5UC94_9GAMM|nr:MBL fold metallo-hydrolase [Spartinivicinus sp. A2-2]MDE1464000.1 MBL fold metallo-hydrolase [Spartinivicinus sp. A2-2]